jgi:hypothetical protein
MLGILAEQNMSQRKPDLLSYAIHCFALLKSTLTNKIRFERNGGEIN